MRPAAFVAKPEFSPLARTAPLTLNSDFDVVADVLDACSETMNSTPDDTNQDKFPNLSNADPDNSGIVNPPDFGARVGVGFCRAVTRSKID
jgi:hypothetical protein